MIRAVLFDLDETLLDRTQSLHQFVQEQYQRFRPHFQQLSLEEYWQRFVEVDAQGTVWKGELYQQLIAEEKITGIGCEELREDYLTRFADCCVGFPYLHETLAALAAGGYALGIVTNGPSPFQERNIEALGIRPYFGAILVSEAEGVRKPEAEIFLRAAARLGVGVDEVVFVGDNPDADIAGAQACGMRAIWFSPRARNRCTFADEVCDGLAEMLCVLDRLENGRAHE